MEKRFEPVQIPTVEVERVFSDFEKAELGQWYWVKNEGKEPILMCAMEIGSNYVQLHTPEMRGYTSERVHRDQFNEILTYEPNADYHIQQMVNHYQRALAENMDAIQRLTESLGIAPQLAHQPSGDTEGKSLALLSGQVDVTAFKNALILAKQETLPALFKKTEEISNELARWMGALSMPMKAKLAPMKASVDKIEDRLFNIQLYSGLLETVFTLSEGQPASREEKLRIMQRRLYMDEECLLDYEAGGMTFDGINEFDKWLAKPVNRDRILPFQRCMVSMRVRRDEKDRSGIGLNAFIQIREAQADKFTYLIVRNGEQLYRVCTDIDFGEQMFPERAVFDPSEPMMMKLWSHDRIESMMTKREFDSRMEESERKLAQSEQWELENPREEWEKANPYKTWNWGNPYRDFDRFNGSNWHPFDDSSTFYDLGMRKIQGEIKEYNRIALIVQGLFDRTQTLIPHNPVQMWRPASFAASVELVYDNTMALHWGEAPDINAYVAACNAKADADSIMFGQEHLWMVREAERENAKTDNNWRIPSSNKYHYKTLRPQGDPGPGRVARPASWTPRSKMATFTWLRARSPHSENLTKAQIKVPLDELFNVSAYKLGDFKQFFSDPRTRAKYLQWAPMLLSAEDYHRGALKATQPLPSDEPKTRFRF
ncbi:hypothetical protein [Pseudomonas sp. MWU12-2323]|uniref:hypothetical protein n=1 Tax=Pseudomonas sp. MWU12-2323 TaxID=2651296 RepID=UPI00128C42C9|nr:hypothetical protein [Pseudomonas sp. MWU12-2323]MPQ71467.1 hypothetical protein [Pseudomonas sp. MWU12-2323]